MDILFWFCFAIVAIYILMRPDDRDFTPRWEKGRQLGGYDKLLILQSKRWRFDCWLLRFNEGSFIPPHRDHVKSGRHFRLNIILVHARDGGEFNADRTIYDSYRIKLFRSDLSVHEVTEVIEGRRYVLSIGWIRD